MIDKTLVYLGFLNASEMGKKLFEKHENVEKRVKQICRKSNKANSEVYVPGTTWNNDGIVIGKGIRMYSVIRSMDLTIVKAVIKTMNGKEIMA